MLPPAKANEADTSENPGILILPFIAVDPVTVKDPDIVISYAAAPVSASLIVTGKHR